MRIKSIIAIILAVAMLSSIAVISGFSATAQQSPAPLAADEPTGSVPATEPATEPQPEAPNPYTVAAQAVDSEYAYQGDDLGCSYTKASTTFRVWAPTATEITLNLYSTGSDDEDGAETIGNYPMTKVEPGGKFNGCWSYTAVGDIKGVYYTYSVTSTALVTDKTFTGEIVDPYAKAVGVNGNRGMVVDLDSTDPDGWAQDKHVFVDNQTDAIVWEIVIKDFSASETSGVTEANRGKYLAFTEDGTTINGEGLTPTCVDYLKELGVTHVQINPFFDFSTVNETGSADQFNWGYDPKNYNAPEGSYSSNPYDGNVRINECKQMIQALHDAGIGVIMDVVYNHTYLTTTSNFQVLAPNYYYRMNASGGWSNCSGCANDTASERAMYRKFMIESCRYWVEEYHVDGFRYDLMGIHDAETMNLIRADLDEIDPRIIMYGEGWSAASSVFDPTTCAGTSTVSASQRNASALSSRVALFNDEIRDALKGNVFADDGTGYLQGTSTCYGGVAYGIRANTIGKGCTWSPVAPSQCVTYTSCHDNHTLYDRLVTSVYGKNVDYRQRYSDLLAMNKLSSSIILTSQGISFMLAGEEMARSKDGDTNSYNASVAENQIDWYNAVSNADLVSYYRGMIDIRKAFSPFTASEKDEFTYTMNGSLSSVDTKIAYTVDNTTPGEWEKVAVMFNCMPYESNTVTLKDTSVTDWVIIADNTTAGLSAIKEVHGSTFTIAPSSCIIAVDKASFDKCGFESGDSRVTVRHIDNETGKLLTAQVITGKVGDGYVTAADTSLSLEYDFNSVEGNAQGTFANDDITVTYKYDRYLAPSLINNDLTGDNKLSIQDATAIQKRIASIIDFTSEQDKLADYDYSGKVNVKDATFVQKHLASISVSIGTVTTNYYYVKDDGTKVNVADSVTKKYRVGSEYNTTAVAAELYTPSVNAPANATGIVCGGDTVVDYFYDYSGSGIKIHAIHLDGTATWTPFLWAWSGSTNAFKSWPGVAMMDDGDGWFSIDAALPEGAEYSVIISNNGSPQSTDYTGLTSPQCWLVINDYTIENKGDFIMVYDEKPDIEALRSEYAIAASTAV